MIIKSEIQEMIQERLLGKEHLLEEDHQFLDGKDKEKIYGKQLEEILDDKGKRILDEYVVALDKKFSAKEILSYLVGASDISNIRNLFDEIK